LLEMEVNKFHKLCPWQHAIVTFQGVVPLDSYPVHVQRCQPDLLSEHCACATKIGFTMVQPWQQICLAITSRKIELRPVKRVTEVIPEVLLVRVDEEAGCVTIGPIAIPIG
jgi:hypothetical protein